ncbi:TRAP transporter substrate-binding protein DctP [Dechloromonas sp. ZY10]|uniref:TRAP transporter substrate-binding protein DctP n=1 Tax=Dechloromonas aquae TaxID=2664436 RepID=UPI0035298B58
MLLHLTRLLLVCAAVLVIPQAAAQSYRSEYRLSCVLGSGFPWGQAAERWAELVREQTQGRINIRLYTGASLVGGDQTREFPSIQQGVIDLAVGSTINWSPQVKELNLFSLPFLLPDHKAIDALTQGAVGRELFAVLEKNGVIPLAWGENGFRELSNSRKPIALPADMKGMKFRVVGSPVFVDIFNALKARPMLMSWVDAQPALVEGVVDGQENPLSVYLASNMLRVGQRYLTAWRYVADPLIFVVNPQVWAGWSVSDRQIVRQAAQQAARENIERARRGLMGHDASQWRQLEAAGVSVTHLTAAQRAAFVQATRPVYDKWRKTIGAELVGLAEQAIAARKEP